MPLSHLQQILTKHIIRAKSIFDGKMKQELLGEIIRYNLQLITCLVTLKENRSLHRPKITSCDP
jgi:hypothetical protein